MMGEEMEPEQAPPQLSLTLRQILLGSVKVKLNFEFYHQLFEFWLHTSECV
jgi:hypothetical protein